MKSIHWHKRKTIKVAAISKKKGFFAAFKFVFIRLLEDRWLLGKWVELKGDSEKLDGCTFDLSHANIATFLKSRFLLNSWEEESRYLFKKHMPKDMPLVEFGASIGIVSCITNKQLTHPESHVVVEANPHLLPILEKNRTDNNCGFKILNKAVAYGAPEVHFNLNDRCNEGSVSQTATDITVPTITLQNILDTEGFTKINMVCDIEGAEVDLVENEGHVLRDHVEWIIMELHGAERSRKTCEGLEKQGFELVETFENNRIYHKP